MKWVVNLLINLKLVAVFVKEKNIFYFFPSVLCRAQLPPKYASSSIDNDPPPLLIGFSSGFCPRGIPGSLITYLMNNHEVQWEFRSKQVYRNQVSFEVGRGNIILKILCTHLEIKLDLKSEVSDFTEDDKRQTCTEAFTKLNKAMSVVTERLGESESSSFCSFGFYCTYSKCEADRHFTRMNLKTRTLKCKVYDERSSLPKNYKMWIPDDQPQQGSYEYKN